MESPDTALLWQEAVSVQLWTARSFIFHLDGDALFITYLISQEKLIMTTHTKKFYPSYTAVQGDPPSYMEV